MLHSMCIAAFTFSRSRSCSCCPWFFYYVQVHVAIVYWNKYCCRVLLHSIHSVPSTQYTQTYTCSHSIRINDESTLHRLNDPSHHVFSSHISTAIPSFFGKWVCKLTLSRCFSMHPSCSLFSLFLLFPVACFSVRYICVYIILLVHINTFMFIHWNN